MSSIIDKSFPYLCSQYPFYAHLYATRIIKIEKNTLPAPMGVCFKNEKIYLYYNTKMIQELDLTLRDVSQIVYHEIRHVTNGHVFMSERKGMKWNVAMDLEINKDLPQLTEKIGVNVEKMNKQYNLQMEEGKTSGYYYYHLPHDGNLDNELDDHSSFEESDKSAEAKEKLAQIIRESFESFKKRNNVSDGLIQELDGFLKTKVNWKKQFKNILTNAYNVTRTKTRSRVNRRLGWQLQGSKKDDRFNIVFCIDTSGSMSTESLSQCWAELKSIHKSINCKITIIEADSEVHNVKEFNPLDIPKFSGRGGTAYTPAILEALLHNPDIICYYGDFDTADIPQDPKVPFLWIGVGEAPPPADFGKVIRIPE